MDRPQTPFLQQVQQDFYQSLLNPFEFGRYCNWNGGPLLIAEGARRDDKQTVSANGANAEEKQVYCRQLDISPWPVPLEQISFDGEPWLVRSVDTLFAHLIITIERRVS
jgi:hypothetical protein